MVSVLLVLQPLFTADEPPPAASGLLFHLITPQEKNCQVSTPVPGGMKALSCSLEAGPILAVKLSLFPSIKLLRRRIEQRETELGASPGSCYSQALAVEQWSKGTLICNYGGGDLPASLEWSREDSRVLVQAMAAPNVTAPELYDWWRHDSVGSPSNNRLPYPDGYETYILEAAERDVGRCRRTDQFRDSQAAVECDAAVPDFLFLGYYGDVPSLRQSIAVEKISHGSCRPIGQVPGLSSYSLHGERAGVRACYRELAKKKVVVEWTNEHSRLYGYAVINREATVYGLFAWWDSVGKYLTDLSWRSSG